MKNKTIKRISNFGVLDEQLSDEILTRKLKEVIKRIEIFDKMIASYSFSNKHIVEIYDWFLNTNLLNLYCFSDALGLNKNINKDNPFWIWSHMYNCYKHLGAEHDTSINLISKMYHVPTKIKPKWGYKTIDEIKTNSILIERFWNPILNDGMKKKDLNTKLNSWHEFKNFFQFIIDNKPNDFLNCKETEFEKLKFRLWKWYKD